MLKSFMNEIKSYVLFTDYLLTDNETKNQISTELMSKSLEYESYALRSYNDVLNGTGFESLEELSG